MTVHQWHRDTIGQKAVQALIKNQFDAVYFPSKEEAGEYILKFISPGAQVGFGGSMTLTEGMGLVEKTKAKGAELLVHGDPQLSAEEKLEVMRQQQICDVFLTSTNAVTLDGCLVNIDGNGNRVAAMTFGPKKVVVVAGVNKICKDIEAAFGRLQSIAAPKNNKRLNLENPCTITGSCANCQNASRICRIYSVLKKKPSLTDITVVIIGEELGY
ncbi:lactate utilization protein [Desulfotomaculum defluvii]